MNRLPELFGLPSCSLKFSAIKSAFAFLIAKFVTFF